jgi:hypothetical protein
MQLTGLQWLALRLGSVRTLRQELCAALPLLAWLPSIDFSCMQDLAAQSSLEPLAHMR